MPRKLPGSGDGLIVASIIIIALCLRLLYVGFISGRPVDRMSDEKDYDQLGLSLAAGKGFVNNDGEPTSRRAPIPSLFYAMVYLIFGHNIAAVRIVQAFISAITCFMIYLLGKEIFSKRAGILSCAISAVYPVFIVYAGMLVSETFLIFFLVTSVYFLLRRRGNADVNSFLTGIAFGAACLTRPSILVLPFAIIFISEALKKASFKNVFRRAAILAFAITIVVMPWTIRNYLVHKEFVPINTQFGYTFLCSYIYPDKGFGFQNEEIEGSLTKGVSSEARRSRILAQYTLRKIAEAPSKYVRLLPLKFAWFWDPFDGRDYGFKSSYNIVYGVTFLFFIVGLAGSLRIWRDLLPIYVIIGYFVLFALIFYGCRRFRMQAEPFIIILASYGALMAGEEWRKNNAAVPILVMIGLILNLAFFFAADNIKSAAKEAANFFGYNAFPGK